MQNVLIDAGPMIALFDSGDAFHRKIKEFLSKNQFNFVTSWPVLTEVCHMLDFNRNAQIDFLKWISRGAIEVAEIEQNALKRIVQLTEKYADIPMDLADATLVLLSETRGIRKIVTIDRDFNIYRAAGKKIIMNIFPNT